MRYMPFFLCLQRPLTLRPSPTSRRKSHGFTLLEVMVVVAIMGVLAALAAPSFNPLIERWRVRQVAEQLQSTLHFARSEAIKRGGRVVIEKLPNNTNGCTTATGVNDWDCGWIVCEDTDVNGKCDVGEQELQRIDTNARVHVIRRAGGADIKLNRWGLVDGAWLGFNLVPLDKTISNPSARGLCMSSGGRVRIIPQEDIPCSG